MRFSLPAAAYPHAADRHELAEILGLRTRETIMPKLSECGLVVAILAVGANVPATAQQEPLSPVSAFSTIGDERARLVALFIEPPK
jgi:hypothetical protein